MTNAQVQQLLEQVKQRNAPGREFHVRAFLAAKALAKKNPRDPLAPPFILHFMMRMQDAIEFDSFDEFLIPFEFTKTEEEIAEANRLSEKRAARPAGA